MNNGRAARIGQWGENKVAVPLVPLPTRAMPAKRRSTKKRAGGMDIDRYPAASHMVSVDVSGHAPYNSRSEASCSSPAGAGYAYV